MARWLLRLDGSFTAGARAALVIMVAGGFALGFLARGGAGGAEGGSLRAAPVSQGRIEADLPAEPARSGPTLTSVAALPSLAAGPRPAHRALAAATPEPTPTATATATPSATPTATPEATPVATAAPPVPVSAPAPAKPKPAPPTTTFDSSG
jgi:hypothetical protein